MVILKLANYYNYACIDYCAIDALITNTAQNYSQSFLLNLLIKRSLAQLMKFNFIVQALHTSLILINDVL